MKLSNILRSSTFLASMALMGFAVAVAAPTSAAAERLIPMPSGLCSWDYSSSGTDILFSRLAARDDFDPSMGYVTANCATALCKADWTGEGAKATIALIQKGAYYGDLVRALGKSCPDALVPLTEGATASIVTPFVSGQENDSSSNGNIVNGGDEPTPPTCDKPDHPWKDHDHWKDHSDRNDHSDWKDHSQWDKGDHSKPWENGENNGNHWGNDQKPDYDGDKDGAEYQAENAQ